MAAQIRTSVRFRCAILIALAGIVLLASAATLRAQQDALNTIRSDVRDPPPAQPSPPPASSSQSSGSSAASDAVSDLLNSDDGAGWLVGAVIVGGAVTAPIWAPHELLDDNFALTEYFPQYPYDGTSGYLVDAASPVPNRPFAVRLDADYVEAFDHLDLSNGHILVSTAVRFEFDARVQHLGENLPGGQTDQLWIGDCNVMFRFAQSSFAEFRAGLGMNWLNDSTQTDLGFNFTYGVDVFAVKPLIFSAVLDAGNLGHAGLFRFRTTAASPISGWSSTPATNTPTSAARTGTD